MVLTDAKIRVAKGREKAHKLSDEKGLFLLVTPDGSRLWRHKYRVNGREQTGSYGPYPEVSLSLARDKRDATRAQLKAGIDPGAARKTAKLARGNTLSQLSEEWLGLQSKKLAAITLTKARWLLGFVLPSLGSRPIGEIKAAELLAELKKIEAAGHHETAMRTKQRIGQIIRFAVATGRAERDITQDLKGALAPVVTTHHAAVTNPQRVGALLRAIDGYQGQPATHAALQLAPLLFVRPGELRGARWDEFNLEEAEWRIPASRMKMKVQHVVPLATQALAILKELRALTGPEGLLFPSLRSPLRSISNNTLTAALRRMGFTGDEMTAHGFRSLASTLLNEKAYAPDLIELQLAHSERNKVRAAYNRAQRLPERRKMMQDWADYLDGLRIGAKVISISRKAAP